MATGGVCLGRTLGSEWTGTIFAQGIRYWRQNSKSPVQCSENPMIGEENLEVLWELKPSDQP